MKGIILAGGAGTRLMPATKSISKQVLPLYDKPMIFYPLSTLMLSGIQEILIISTPRDLPIIEELLGDGSSLGISLSYACQEKPEGIAQAFLIGEEFIGNDRVALILGDNVFYSHGLAEKLQKTAAIKEGASVFAYHVSDPERYGVVGFDNEKNVIEIIEKPKKFVSNWAVTGLYFYDSDVAEFAKKLKPSARGELEISDLNGLYLKEKRLKVEFLGRGTAWLDTGTPESLLQAANFIQMVEQRQGLKIGCIEEVALNMGYIDMKQCNIIADSYGNSEYSQYLKQLVKYQEFANAS